VDTVLESPSGLRMGGEKRKLTMMMTDLRGFTSLSDRLPADRVVKLLNRYLAAMVPVIKEYQGTIDEFIGDAIFVLFGAPVWHEDDAERAVACAVAMQIAMEVLNAENRKDDLPEVEMGIGIHTGQVVLGNIGSPERMKYGVVGSNVNLTSRIQACTTGGQILVSETTRQELGSMLKIGKQMEVRAKGVEHPVVLFEVLGIGGRHKLALGETVDMLVELPEEIPILYEVVESSQVGGALSRGLLSKVSLKVAEARLANPVPPLSNLKLHIIRADGTQIPGSVYGKVLGSLPTISNGVTIRFTSIAPEIEIFLRGLVSAQTDPVDQSTVRLPTST
jgi:adenylate cyclase